MMNFQLNNLKMTSHIIKKSIGVLNSLTKSSEDKLTKQQDKHIFNFTPALQNFKSAAGYSFKLACTADDDN